MDERVRIVRLSFWDFVFAAMFFLAILGIGSAIEATTAAIEAQTVALRDLAACPSTTEEAP